LAVSADVIERSLPLVKSIAARLRRAHSLSASFDEVYALGVDGLLQAAERFDPSRGVAFTTFAYHRIRGAILDSLRRDPERGSGAPARVVASMTVASGVSVVPANDNGRPRHRIAAADHASWIFPEMGVRHLGTLDELASLSDEAMLLADEEIDRLHVERRVVDALKGLPEAERKVVELHYYEELSFAEVGERLGICKPWAFRLHGKAIERLKEQLAELGGEGFFGKG
jgi:RNA polymerase sigma factor for flagellar operon FliA